MNPLTILISRVRSGFDDLPLPSQATSNSVGFDLRAAINEEFELQPGGRALIPTAFAVAIPPGYEGQIRPRSGLALKHGITIPNAPGTIDSDYRGEIQIIILNAGRETFVIHRGDRIAQLVFAPVASVVLQETPALPSTTRGEGGFGHSGQR